MRQHSLVALSLLLAIGAAQADPTWLANGPDGGNITMMAASAGWLYAATGDGIFRSNDQGTNWQRAGNDIPRGTAISTLVVSPHDDNVVLAGSAGFIYRSSDAGASWTSIAVSGSPGRIVFNEQPGYANEVLFASSSSLATQAGALQRSSNAGQTWQSVNGPSATPLLAKGVVADPQRDRYYALDGGQQLLMSINGGTTWTAAGAVAAASSNGRQPMLVNRADNDYVLWSADNLDATYLQRHRVSTGVTSQVFTAYTAQELAADPVVAGRIWFSAIQEFSSPPQRLFESIDHGQTWVDVNADRPVRMLAADPIQSGLLYGTTTAGPEISQDGGRHWEVRAFRIAQAPTRAVLVDSRDPALILAGTTGNGVWRSGDAGQNWQRSIGMDYRSVLSLAQTAQNPDVVYAGTDVGVFRSLDGGVRWTGLPAASFPGSNDSRLTRLFVNRDNGDHLVAVNDGSGKVGWSDDGGLSWRAATGLPGSTARRLAASPNGSGRVYALGPPSVSQPLRRADSHGAQFVTVGVAANFYALAVHPDNDARLVSIQSSPQGPTVYVSDDAGDTWLPRGTLAIASPADESHLRFDPCDPETIYAATGNWVYRSVDRGLSWQQESTPLRSSRHSDLDARCSAGSITVAVASPDSSTQIRRGVASDRILRSSFDET